MAPLETNRIYFDDAASTFAFRAGQVLERLLLDRGIEQARESHLSVVTSEMVQSCMDQLSVDHLRKHLHERDEQESRKVA